MNTALAWPSRIIRSLRAARRVAVQSRDAVSDAGSLRRAGGQHRQLRSRRAGVRAAGFEAVCTLRHFTKKQISTFCYKALGMLSTDCKNQSLRDRVDYKFDCRLQSPEFREPDFFY